MVPRRQVSRPAGPAKSSLLAEPRRRYPGQVKGKTRVGQRAGVLLIASIVLGGSLVIVHRADAGWRRAHGDAYGSNRVDQPGWLAGDLDHHPGFSEIVELEQPELPATRLHDVTGDGVPELLLTYRGRVAALDLTQGGFAWQSPVAGIDRIVDFADFDGDGTPELLAASRSVGGALLSLDPNTGAILSRTDPLPNRSGVAAEELAIADVDQDGDDDVVYPAAFYGLAQLWVGGLGPGAESWTLALDFTGYANITPVHVGRFVSAGEPAVILDQSPTQRLFERCAPTAPEAACSAALCLCPTATLTGVHPISTSPYAMGPTFVIDVDGDDLDELIKIANDVRYTRSLSVFSPAAAKAAGSGAAGQLWYRDYSQGSAITLPLVSAETPIDLDGDGGIELLVNFVDNLADDRDSSGAPISDGINHLGVSFGVFDARTGAVETTLDDAFAHGWLDLDGNGLPELIVSPVSGYAFGTGLFGYELGCGSGCLQLVWSLPHAFAPASVREAFGRAYLPTPELLSLRVGDQDALLAYDGDTLHLLRAVNGQLQSVANRQLEPEQVVVDVGSGHALLSDGRSLQLVDAQLQNIGPATPIPVQGHAPWLTARFGGFDAPVFESKLYATPLPVDDSTGSFADPIELLPNVALAENLDAGSASDEIIDFRRPEDELGAGFELRALAWQQDQLITRWSLTGDELPALAGLELPTRMHYATGNFDGSGSDDLVFAARDTAHDAHLVFVDGDSGELLGIVPAGKGPASFTPLLVGDLSGPDGKPHADGLDDVLVDGPLELGLYVLNLFVPGQSDPVWRADNGFYHGVGAQADVDGDGRRELIATTSNTLDNPGAVYDFDVGMQPLWGPAQLGLPTGRAQVMAFAHVDGQAGLDMLYITGEGGLELRNGQTGAMLPGAPVFVAKGSLHATAQPNAASLAALIVLDVDNDGHDEAVLGADDGWVYALNLADENGGANTASLEWALEVGAPVSSLAAGDVDRDGFQELLVSTAAGQGIVLDSLGVALDIINPDGSCFEVGTVDVDGIAYGVAVVDLWLNGVLVDSVDVGEGGMWTGKLELPGAGEYEIRAEGRDEAGELVALATSSITYGGDEDGDGVSACGGDCDDLDADVAPGQGEICGDGIDQDCDGEDLVCGDDEGDGGSFPGPESWDPKSRCDCSTGDRQRGAEGVLALLGMVVLGWRRRGNRTR